nr:hypothetical protein [Dickeya dadantii]
MKFDNIVVLNSNEILAKDSNLDLNFNTLFQMPTKYVGQAIAMSRVFQDAINGTILNLTLTKPSVW